MNIRLTTDLIIYAGVYFNNKFFMAQYSIILGLTTNTADPEEQAVAMQRIKIFAYEILNGSIFIYEKEEEAIKKFIDAGMKTVALPAEPYDQIVQIALFTKFNAITESRLIVTDIQLGSSLSDNMRYLFDSQESVGPFDKNGWWDDPEANWFDRKSINDRTPGVLKVLKLSPALTWKELDLGWESNLSQNSQDNIVFGNFGKILD